MRDGHDNCIFSGELEVVRSRWLFMLQQKNGMYLYGFNKVSWYEGYDNKD